MVAIVESDQLHSITQTDGAHLAGSGMGLRTSCRARAVGGREIGNLRVAVAHASLARLIVQLVLRRNRDVIGDGILSGGTERTAIELETASRRQRLHVEEGRRTPG